MDRNFNDLLDGQDYVTTRLEDSWVGKVYRRLKVMGGLTLMMTDIIVKEKMLGHQYDPIYDAPFRNLDYNPWGANPNSPTYPYELEPSPRRWAK